MSSEAAAVADAGRFASSAVAAPPKSETTSRAGAGAARGVLAANALIFFNTLLRSASSLLVMPVMATALGAERYGLWITVSTVTMYFSLAEGGLGQAVVNQIGRAHALGRTRRVGEIMATAHVLYWLTIVVVGLAATTALLVTPLAERLLAEEDQAHAPLLRTCLILSTTMALVRIPYLVFPGLLIGVRRLPLRVVWEIGGTLLALGATLAALRLGAGLIELVIVNNAALFVATAAICLSSARVGEWARLRWRHCRPALIPKLASSSGWFFLINAAMVVDRGATTLLVPRFASLAATPPFFLLVSLFRVAGYAAVSSLPRAIQPYVVFWASTGERQRLVETMALAAKATALLAALGTALFVPFGRLLIDAWLGPGSYPGDWVTLLVAGGFLADAFCCTPQLFLVSMDRQRALAGLMVGKAALTIALSIALASIAGDPLVGLAAGALVASLLAAAGIVSLIRPALALEPRRHVREFVLAPLACATIVPAAAVISLRLAPTELAATASLFASAASAALCWRWTFCRREREFLTRLVNGFRTARST